ncbi:MAG: cation diffusion facilitator family transporter [Marivibrio sp.]|uniref:cation diffusion facilitator family transporter n=1 Tax=Marivibrio sp. TaxID=2039719 RepID=UPI0032EDAFA1
MADPIKKLRGMRGRESRLMRWATYASTATALTLIVAKTGAWFATESVAMLSSLIDSLLDSFASLVTLIAVRQALTPADADHRFGHGKAEPLAAMMQAGFIAGSAALLLIEAIDRLIDPQPVTQTEIGLAVMTLSVVLTLALVSFQTYVVRRSKSVAIQADSVHYKADLLANVGVMLALVASGFFGLTLVDPLFGIAIAAYILKGAWDIGGDAFNMLMDRELPDEERERIKEIALGYSGVLGVHDLRTRRSGPDVFIQMHLDLNGALSLNRAHTIADAVEKDVMERFPGAEVFVHQDPVTPESPPDVTDRDQEDSAGLRAVAHPPTPGRDDQSDEEGRER